MALEVDWRVHTENGLQVRQSVVSPLTGDSSLQFYTDATLQDSPETLPFRKSGSVCLRLDRYPTRGFANGRIQTLIRRASADQATGWSGIFCMCSRENTGTRLTAAEQMYQVTDKDGTLRILRFWDTIPTTVATFATPLPVNATRAFEVEWNLSGTGDEAVLSLVVRLGTALDFSNLAIVGTYTDATPLTTPRSEGLFAQTIAGDDSLDYKYDDTKVILYRKF